MEKPYGERISPTHMADSALRCLCLAGMRGRQAHAQWALQAIRRAREALAAAAAQPLGALRPVPSFVELAAMHAPRRMFEDAVRAAQAAGIVSYRNGS